MIYFDEAAVNIWMRRNSTYSGPKINIKTIINPRKYPSITVYGAIGECLGDNMPYELGSTTSAANVMRFF